MKKNLIKIMSLSLASLMMLTSVPTYADYSEESVTYQTSDEEDFSTETSVLAEIGSEYKVTIPKVIVLSGVTKSADYYVKVEGDIAGLETVNVVPDETVDLYANNKSIQVGTITQDKTSWQYDNFDVDANGSVTANGITAGKWSGAFNFNINLGSSDEETVLAPGLYDENNNLIKSWDELIELGLDIEKDYTDTTYKTAPTSGYSVFTNNNLSGNLILPNTITKIGDFNFNQCSSLKSIIIPNNVTSIGRSAFNGCASLESVTIPNSITSISRGTFILCTSLESVTIPDSVTSIGDFAFLGCSSLNSITIPDNVTSIGNIAFRSVKHIYYNGSATGAPWGALAIN